jgi:iron complex outermembrane receptor protein
MKKHRYFSFIILSLLLSAGTCFADSIDDELAYLQAELTSTASRYTEKTTDTPSTVIVITKQQIQERGYTNLLQVLESLPNIDIQRYASQVTGEQISIRGIAKNHGFLVLQDGIRINSPTGEFVPINDNFPIHYAKKIEIVYGPASVMYGADALTGVINIISEKAEETDGVEVKGFIGEYNTYATQIKAGKKINDYFSITAGGHYKESDNANLAKYYPNDFRLNDLTTFGGQTAIKAQDRGGYQGENQSYSAFSKLTFFKDLDIGINYSFEKHRSDVGELPSYADYAAKAYLNKELGTVYANYKFDVNKDLGGFLRANYSWYELTPESRFINKYNDFTQTGGYKYAHGERKQLEGQLQYKITPQHIVSAGFSLEDYYSIPKTVDLDFPYNPDKSPDNQNAFYPGTNNTLPVKMQQFRYTNIAGYAQWSAAWHEMLSTTVAFRYDASSRYQGTFNPKLGLVFKPTNTVTTKFQYGTAFLAPSTYYSGEQYGTFSGKTGNTYTSDFFHIPNHNLKPETIDTFEFNADYQTPDKNLKVGVNAYYNTLKGIISPAPTPNVVSDYIPGGYISFTEHNENIGKITSYGGDVHFDYQTRFDDSTLNLWGNYSYVDGKLSRKGENFSTALPIVANHKVKLGLTYTYQNKYTITPKLYWIGKTTSSQPENNQPQTLQTIPDYLRVDLYASAKIVDNFSLFVNVNNLFDNRYYNTGDLYPSSMPASPQDPRTVSGGFIFQFGK